MVELTPHVRVMQQLKRCLQAVWRLYATIQQAEDHQFGLQDTTDERGNIAVLTPPYGGVAARCWHII